MKKVLTEVIPLSEKDCFYMMDRDKEAFSYPLHKHDEMELNFVENCDGARRIVGDSIEVLGRYDLVLVGSGLEHTWDQYDCQSHSIHEITIQFPFDLLGEQFLALLDGEDGSSNSLYFAMAAEADRQAMAIRKAFEEKGVKLLHDSYTNQQFFVLPDAWYETLRKDFAMTHMGKPDKTHTAVRICTSWATKAENVQALIDAVKGL